jgi:hypothetical protein
MVARRGQRRKLVLYELNEVPWKVVDLYVAGHPESNLAGLLDAGLSQTTVNDDPVPLQPWRTWPTFHTSTHTDEHNSFELGQDPSTFRGTTIWDAAEGAGLSVGLFGPLQSWPARKFAHGGFFVPDTFSRTADTFPGQLRHFQQFNITMTAENTFSSHVDPGMGQLVTTGLDLLRRGLTPSSLLSLAAQLVRERQDGRYRGQRSTMQVLPSFDLYWRLHLKHEPDLSIFFTNHVAGMMHRYWGDWVPEYAASEGYVPDPVFRSFVPRAMDMADRQLGRIRRYVDSHPDTVVVVAASMGQGPIPYRHLDRTFVLEAPARLLDQLGLGSAEPGLAMYPRISLAFASHAEAASSVAVLGSVEGEGCGPMFRDFTVSGRTVSFEINFDRPDARDDEKLAFVHRDGVRVTLQPADLGIAVRSRTGGGNTAYHVPEGILLTYGAGIAPDPARTEVDILDVAPSLLANVLGAEPPPSMRGTASLFG